MFKIPQAAAFILAIIAILLFYFAYFHHQKIKESELSYATTLSSISSKIRSHEKSDTPSLTSTASVITEDRAVLFVFSLSCLLALISLLIILRDRLKNGKDRHSFSLILLPLGIMITTIITIYKMGLFQ